MRGALLWVVALLSVASTKPQFHNGDQSPSSEKELKIVGGKDAVPGLFPHHVLVIREDRSLCGGSLISENSVLTAGHCLYWCRSLTLRMGGVYRLKDEPTAWIIVSRSFKLHEEYVLGDEVNDVGLIFLPEKPPFSSYIRPVKLPTELDAYETFAGYQAFISGFGSTAHDEGYPSVLKWAQVVVVTNYKCSWHFRPGAITEKIICAHNIYSSACYGDSGGALVLKIGESYKQIGVVNFGPKYCQTYIPTAYARVTSHLRWIKKNAKMQNEQLDLSVA